MLRGDASIVRRQGHALVHQGLPRRRMRGSGHMASERFLVTGALGCIGSWAVKRLVDEGIPVTTYDLPGDPHRMRLIMSDDAVARVNFVEGDITDDVRFEQVIRDNQITHVLHLAALQVPFVRANPILGARVNVVGSAVVFETARKLADQIQGLAYASSIAVYGSADRYPPGPLADDAPLAPVTLYGVTKQANEGWAAIYWQDYTLSSVGLRPFFVYGPGRDQGVSSTPTKAMAAAAVGRPYRVSFGGTDTYQHADDVARVFIAAARTMPAGAPVYNLGGTVASVADVVAAIERAAPESAGTISFEPESLFTPNGVEGKAIEELLGPIAWRPLDEGVADTIAAFRTAAAAGRLDADRAIA
jgi:nucleoside-diphosphate-sugar epimerase